MTDALPDIPASSRPGPGAAALQAALAAGDRAAVLGTLRGAAVVVPHLEREDGTPQVRVFDAPDGSARPYELCLFSSAAALSAFLQDDPGREFSLRGRDSLAPFLRRHGAVLERVVVDPAGGHAMVLSVAEALGALDLDADAGGTGDGDPTGLADDSGAGISIDGLHAMATVDEPGGSRGIGIELNLPDHWAVVDLDDPHERGLQIRAIVKQQTAVLGDRGAPLRRDLREQLTAVAERAATAGGRVMAYLTLPGKEAALALNLTLYWHDLGPEVGGVSHLQRIDDRLRPTLGPDDALTTTETLSGPFLRHVRAAHGSPELGGQDVPLLLVDYWAPAPGAQSVARLAFSTPHVEARDAMLGLTDRVLFATEWLMSEPGAADGAAVPVAR
ncbi:SseB family protein [Isoptericola sp. NEAU-Y5]|uniref:SseB family protein n=1 Tax=Isoptericola luteus TaxID=2879484 RepID=A0ABS7ZGA4_9MICO|nr:SseB family protein [Isoptericola sp. NEAU-Y5]MCA5894060.1 SseB family protein [Isoptericola sp. NEAU-Y5]